MINEITQKHQCSKTKNDQNLTIFELDKHYEEECDISKDCHLCYK